MTENDHSVSRRRGLGYICIFSRSVEEASTTMVREITAGLMDDGPAKWIELIEGWLTEGVPLVELSFGGARFSDAEWGAILKRVAEELHRNLTGI